MIQLKAGTASPKYGCRPKDRPVSELLDYGIVNIDKPRGPTSHQVADYAKKILGADKAGHSGTLDPKVTGVLPIAVGRATRVVQALLISGKEYVAIMHVHAALPEPEVRSVCQEFVGRIRQLPPVKSSVKRQYRYRNVYYLEIIEIKGQDVLMRVGTQAGTYIRKLIHDIGQKLGCGAHMAELRRTKAGPFDESSLATLQDLADAVHLHNQGNDKLIKEVMMPIERGVEHLGKIWVLDTTVDTLCHGASLKVPGIAKLDDTVQKGQLIALMTLKDELIALANSTMDSQDIKKAGRGIAASTQKVFMLPGTYPKVEVKR